MPRGKKNQPAEVQTPANATNGAAEPQAPKKTAGRRGGQRPPKVDETTLPSIQRLSKMLTSKDGVEVKTAATELGITEAKVRFNIDRLRRNGVTITAMGKGVFKAGGTGARPRNRDGGEGLKAALSDLADYIPETPAS